MCNSGNAVVSVQISGGTKAKVGETSDSMKSLCETHGTISGAHDVQKTFVAREC